MGYVFVDIDGVLRRGFAASRIPGVLPALNQDSVNALSSIAKADPALEFILSSAWRVEYGYDRTVKYLESLGFPKGRFVGQTPDLSGRSGIASTDRRRAEYEAFLKAHDEKAYVILDDNRFLGALSLNQIMPTMNGLREAQARVALKLVKS